MLSPQGWDCRLLTPGRAKLLERVRHAGKIHFAWDNIKDENRVIRAIEILKGTKFNLRGSIIFYVLVGFGISNGKPVRIPFCEDDVYRCEKLKEFGVNSYIMPYHKTDKMINKLMRWANWSPAYWSMSFEEFLKAKK
jgi:hypothetical protein